MINCCIFDLDGVIVDTAKYHFLAWRRLAEEFDIEFTEEDNEALKGVSRIESLKLILKLGDKQLDEATFNAALDKKNSWYLEYINKLDRSEILPGIEVFLEDIRSKGIKTALGSASKNAVVILERLNLISAFDTIVDGTKVTKAKPDPEVFLKAAENVGVPAEECIVFEDAAAGVDAAISAKMRVIGIGTPDVLGHADLVVTDLQNKTLEDLL